MSNFIVHQVDDGYLEIEVTELRDRFKIANLFGIAVAGCKVSVIFVREGLTGENRYDIFHSTGADSRSADYAALPDGGRDLWDDQCDEEATDATGRRDVGTTG